MTEEILLLIAWKDFSGETPNFSKVVSILETPIPTISSTLALNPDPLVSVLSKTVKSPTLYPSPPSNTVKSFILPFVTDSIFEICLMYYM